jgi:hypothetical protein
MLRSLISGALVSALGLLGSITSFAQTFAFNIETPSPNAFAGDSLPIQVSVASTYEIKSVTVSVEGRLANLFFRRQILLGPTLYRLQVCRLDKKL